jgi:cyclase
MGSRVVGGWNVMWFAVVILTAMGLCGEAHGQENRDFSKVQIKVTKVSGNIYMLEGEGGNIAASVGEDGIVIVDDQYAPLAEKIHAALKDLKITDKPVRFVINTHYHGDHTGGNEPFANAGSTVIAQDNVRKRLEAGGTAGNGGSMKVEVKPSPKGALPVITFEHDVTVHLNGEDIRALHFPAGHTDGDAVIFFPKNNVVHMGDDFVRHGFPFIDAASGGSVLGMIVAMEKVSAQLPPRRESDSRTRSNLESRRCAGVLEDAEGDGGGGAEGAERAQNAGTDEAGEDSGTVEEVVGRVYRQR